MEVASERSRLLKILAQSSFRDAKSPVFRLASQRMSRYYVDCKKALSDPEARSLIGKLILERIEAGAQSIDAVGGLEIGAYPIATSVSDEIFRQSGKKVRVFVVRKQPKTHGIGDLIAGDIREGDRTLIVDDVITTGSSTIDAITRARTAGLNVVQVVVLVDREEDNGQRHIEAQDVSCESLFTLSDLIKASESDETTNQAPYPARSIQAKPS
jgi:orotate phosphoribosyltransferase